MPPSIITFLLAAAFSLTVAGLPAAKSSPRQTASAPIASIKNGTIIGSTSGWVDNFYGIPFALPPVGSLRLRPPEPLTNSPLGIFYATSVPRACPLMNQAQNPWAAYGLPLSLLQELNFFFPLITYTGEDCLTLNVQRPTGTKEGDNLPVIFWIYGGGFESGSTQSYNFANLITNSVTLNHPVIVVQANYRQGTFGFLAGSQVAAGGTANIGLKDQRLALKWVAENIRAFGGDPDKVTLWGQSAGAVSAAHHTLINGGDHTYDGIPLFRAVISDSGTALPSNGINSTAAQRTFDTVLYNSRCAYLTPTYPTAALDCLRSLSYTELTTAASFVPPLVSPDALPSFSFSPRPSPTDPFLNVSVEESFRTGRWARVPVITGVQQDEGTLWSAGLVSAAGSWGLWSDASTFAGFVAALVRIFPATPRAYLENLVTQYSTDPAAGAPFETGWANEIYPGYKRNAAVLGDVVFDFQRRRYLEQITGEGGVNAWTYVSSYGKRPVLGTFHGSELLMFAEGWPAIPYWDVWQYYLSFVYYLDPNAIGGAPNATEGEEGAKGRELVEWPAWKNGTRSMMEFLDYEERIIVDDYRQGAFEYFKGVWTSLRL